MSERVADTSGLINVKNQVVPDELFLAALDQGKLLACVEKFISATLVTDDDEVMAHIKKFREEIAMLMKEKLTAPPPPRGRMCGSDGVY